MPLGQQESVGQKGLKDQEAHLAVRVHPDQLASRDQVGLMELLVRKAQWVRQALGVLLDFQALLGLLVHKGALVLLESKVKGENQDK